MPQGDLSALKPPKPVPRRFTWNTARGDPPQRPAHRGVLRSVSRGTQGQTEEGDSSRSAKTGRSYRVFHVKRPAGRREVAIFAQKPPFSVFVSRGTSLQEVEPPLYEAKDLALAIVSRGTAFGGEVAFLQRR